MREGSRAWVVALMSRTGLDRARFWAKCYSLSAEVFLFTCTRKELICPILAVMFCRVGTVPFFKGVPGSDRGYLPSTADARSYFAVCIRISEHSSKDHDIVSVSRRAEPPRWGVEMAPNDVSLNKGLIKSIDLDEDEWCPI